MSKPTESAFQRGFSLTTGAIVAILLVCAGIPVLVCAGFFGIAELGRRSRDQFSGTLPSDLKSLAVIRTEEPPQVLRERRKQAIAELRARGVFAELDFSGSTPKIWAGPEWHKLTRDQQADCMALLFAHRYDGIPENGERTLRVLDPLTRQPIGTYSHPGGYQVTSPENPAGS